MISISSAASRLEAYHRAARVYGQVRYGTLQTPANMLSNAELLFAPRQKERLLMQVWRPTAACPKD